MDLDSIINKLIEKGDKSLKNFYQFHIIENSSFTQDFKKGMLFQFLLHLRHDKNLISMEEFDFLDKKISDDIDMKNEY